MDIDSFKPADLQKALFTTDDPFKELGLNAQVLEVPVTSMTKAASGRNIGKDISGKLHAVAGIAGETDDNPVKVLYVSFFYHNVDVWFCMFYGTAAKVRLFFYNINPGYAEDNAAQRSVRISGTHRCGRAYTR